MELVHESGAFAVAMDIDAAGLPFLKNLDPPAGSKTVSELSDIIQMAGTPFIVKGIMTVKGALKAKLYQITVDVCWISVLPLLRCLKAS